MVSGIGVINLSTVVNQTQASNMVSAVSTQITRDVCPNWGRSAFPVNLYTSTSSVPTGYAIMYIFDNTDQAGALGYHDELMNGRIYGKIFAHTIMSYGCPILYSVTQSSNITVSSVLSHEVIELMMDPYVDLWADGTPVSQGSQYAYELCDPVESNIYTINTTTTSTAAHVVFGPPQTVTKISGTVSVSNFVYPMYFDTATPPGTKIDQLHLLSHPYTMTSGGYLIIRDDNGNINEVFGEKYPEFLKSIGCPSGIRNANRKG